MSLSPQRETPPGTPRWVMLFMVGLIGLILLVVFVHLLGGGFRGHAPLGMIGFALAWA
jgi:hypothetical protein